MDFKGAVKIAREFTSDWSRSKNYVETTFKNLGQDKTEQKKTYSLEEYARYENALKNSPEAQKFLESRGCTMEVAKRLRIGFRQDVGKLAGESGASVSALGWLAFPTFSSISGSSGQSVTSVKYRSTRGKFFCKQPGMTTQLFNSQTIDTIEPVFLVEGEFDACVLEQAGFRAISLPNAQYTCSPEDKDLLLSAEYVILAGDNDEAGKKAMTKLWAEMKERTFFLTWPGKCKDANQFYLEDCKARSVRFPYKD